MKPGEIALSCYENRIPDFVGEEMEMLYGNIFSSISLFHVYGHSTDRINTYVARQGGTISAVFLFKRESGKVHVLNEGIKVDQETLITFVNYVYAMYPSVKVVIFNAIETHIESFPFPYQCFKTLEDIALDLPTSIESYFSSLGKNTRRNIKRYTDRLKRTFPSFRFTVADTDEVSEKDIRSLIAFNRARMSNKKTTSIIDEEETQRIVRLAQRCGLVGLAYIDGKLAAGAVSFRAGSNYFLNVLSHDPEYDDYWIGFLCCYLTICECIRRGGKEFHFLWGRYEYKFTLGAQLRELSNLAIYRSRLQPIFHGKLYLQNAVVDYKRRLKTWLKYDDSPFSRKTRKILANLQQFAKPLKKSVAEKRHR